MSRNRSGDNPVSLFSLQDIITTLTGIMILLVMILALEAVTQTTVEAVESDARHEEMKAQKKEMEARREALRSELAAREAAAAAVRLQNLNPLDAARQLQAGRRSAEIKTAQAHELERKLDVLTQATAKQTDAVASGKSELQRLLGELKDAEANAAKKSVRPIAFIPDTGTYKTAHLVECGTNGVRVVSLGVPRRNVEWTASNAETAFKEFLRSCAASREYFVFLMKPSGVAMGMNMFYSAKMSDFDAGYDVMEENEGVTGELES